MSQVTHTVKQLMQPLKRWGVGRNPRAYTQGLVPYRQKQWQQAIDCFTQATNDQPEHAPSHFKLGMSHFRLKEYETALAAMTRALELDPSQKQWQEQLDQVARHVAAKAKQSPSDKEQTIRDQIERLDNPSAILYNQLAHTLRKQGKWWQEVEALKSAIALEGHHPTWHYRLGEAQEVMNRYQQAAEAYGEAIKLKNNKAEAQWYYRQGYCFAREGHDGPANQQAAESAYATAIEKDIKLNAQRFGIGVFHQQRGNWLLAKEAYQYSLAQQPWDAELHYRLGMAHDRCYEWAEAETCYTKALTIDTQQPYWHYRLGFVQERQEKFAEAALAYQYAALNREKNTSYWFYRWGYVLEKLGRYDEATQAYLQARQQQTLDKPTTTKITEAGDLSNNKTDNAAVGSNYASQNDTELNTYASQFHSQQFIIDVLEKHLETDTTNPDHWYQLGNAYERNHEWQQALESYQQAVMRSNDFKSFWYYRLGYCLAMSEKYAEACAAFRKTRIIQKAYGLSEESLKKGSGLIRITTYYTEYLESLPLIKDSIVYESHVGKSLSCNPYAMFLSLIKDPYYKNYLHVWVIRKGFSPPEEFKEYANVVFVEKSTDLYLRYLATAEYLINNTTFPPFFQRRYGQKYLNTWHGTPLKTLGKEQKYNFQEHKNAQRNFLQATHLISPNPHTTRVLLDSYDLRPIMGGKLAETGYPRIDMTVNSNQKLAIKIRENLGISGKRPVVLYAPTWRGTLETVTYNIEKIKEDIKYLSGKHDCDLLFRGHHLLEKVFDSNEDVGCTVVDENIDTNQLLSVVDILITDYSSIFFDFLSLGKPIIYYVFDLEEYTRHRGMYFNIEEMPGYKCHDIASLSQSLEEAMSSNTLDSRHFIESIDKFSPHDDGLATQRVIDFFFNDEDEYLVDLRRKAPLNVLINAGGFQPNGITTSFLNLVNHIDTSFVHVTVGVSPGSISNNLQNLSLFERLPEDTAVVARSGVVNMTWEERWVRKQYDNYGLRFSEPQREIIKNIFDREFDRVFGDADFHSCVAFSGYDDFWAHLLLGNRRDSKKIIYMHSDMIDEYKERYPSLEKVFKIYKDADNLVSVSKSSKEVNCENLGHFLSLPKDKFAYCNNVQDPERILSLKDEPLPEEDKAFFTVGKTFINVGRLSPEKDQAKLIDSFYKLTKENHDVKLLIVGEGPLRKELKDKISLLGLDNKVHLLGYRENPYPYILKADCFVLSSNYESMTMALMESIVLGTPFVATDIYGNSDIKNMFPDGFFENSVNGLLEGMTKFVAGDIPISNFDCYQYNDNALEMFYDVLR